MKRADRFTRLSIVFMLTMAAFSVRSEEIGASARRESIAKAEAYLWALQGDDGGWHSTRYGLLRSGQSLTPFVLNALLQAPGSGATVKKPMTERAVAFIKTHLSYEGALGMSDKLLHDYPNYATALAVQALSRVGGERETVDRMVGYLHRQQFAGEAWNNGHLAFGAWGMGGIDRTAKQPGHLDISMTRYVLEGLRAADAESKGKAFEDAQWFLTRCQNCATDEPNVPRDCGFFFSTVVLEANKAGPDQQRFRSYATATADGILSLLACGVRQDDERIKRAANWLLTHHRIGVVPGFPSESAKRWDTGLQFYYYAAAAKVFRELGIEKYESGVDLRAELSAFLIKAQRPDGSWANDNFLVKEDDALIATVFAMNALIDLQ